MQFLFKFIEQSNYLACKLLILYKVLTYYRNATYSGQKRQREQTVTILVNDAEDSRFTFVGRHCFYN